MFAIAYYEMEEKYMERQVDMSEVSDGKLYTSNDMARLGCNDCEGCSKCCHGMGSSIVLDPYDVFRMTKGLGLSFEQLLAQYLELNVVDGIIMPNMKMTGDLEACGFLNGEGRCSIHAHRPGICRMFPLGRIYEENDFHYFLQIHECQHNTTKVKIKKWLDTPNLSRYEAYIKEWHFFVKDLGSRLLALSEEDSKQWNMMVLKMFYFENFDTEDIFFEQMTARIQKIQSVLPK